MIIRKNLKWSSILRSTWKDIAYFLTISSLVYIFYNAGHKELSIGVSSIAIMSTALSIFLAFRNNSAYDRWWEARTLWGSLINNSRSFTRQVLTFMERSGSQNGLGYAQQQKELIYNQVAFAHALRLHLRKDTDHSELAVLLGDECYNNYLKKDNKPNYILQRQGEILSTCYRNGWLDTLRHMQLDTMLTEFSNILGGCERLKNTPLPRQYNFFPRLFVYIHATLLPFGFVAESGWVMIPLTVIVSFVFLSLDRIGEVTEDPFENRVQDVPITALSKTIEINLKEQLGEQNLPEKPVPVDGFLY